MTELIQANDYRKARMTADPFNLLDTSLTGRPTARGIDLFELHDSFSIMADSSLEASGFAERGQGPRLGLDGEICPRGRIPVATRAGLKARGDPVGATGVYQIAEIVQQLRGETGENRFRMPGSGWLKTPGGVDPIKSPIS